MKTTTITLNPGAWLQSLALALRNTFFDIGRMLRNPRLWIGLGSSLAVHGAIILLSVEYGNKKIAEEPDSFWEVYDLGQTEHPKVVQILEQTGPAGSTEDVNTYPIKSSVAEQLQAMTENTLDPTDATAVEPHGFIVLTDKQLSVAEILGREPVKDIRLTGGHSLPGIIPIGPAIDPAQTIVIDPTIFKPVVEPVPVGPDVKEPKPTQGTGFSLQGDLSQTDIVSAVIPRYPNFARAKGLTNVIVVIDFSVNRKGEVSPTLIVKRSTGFPQWDNEVKTALKKWKFKSSETLHRNGQITFKFVLN